LLPTTTALKTASQNLQILFENERILAIEKPHGVAHHSDHDEKGILSILRSQWDGPRLYGVHRLDKVTSGILMFAKDEEMAGLLSKAFREKKITKYYTAISAKKPKKKKQGWIKGNMVPSRRGSWKLVDRKNSKLKEASVRNYASTRFFTAGLGNINDLINIKGNVTEVVHKRIPKTVILFHPITGKTHQIRVAAKSVGLPILGDERYEGSPNESVNLFVKEASRTYLHSTAMHFKLEDVGISGKGDITIISKPPFTDLWDLEDVDLYNPIPRLTFEKAAKNFHGILSTLVQKNCECEQIVQNWLE